MLVEAHLGRRMRTQVIRWEQHGREVSDLRGALVSRDRERCHNHPLGELRDHDNPPIAVIPAGLRTSTRAMARSPS
jgi:hypothetical protein